MSLCTTVPAFEILEIELFGDSKEIGSLNEIRTFGIIHPDFLNQLSPKVLFKSHRSDTVLEILKFHVCFSDWRVERQDEQ